MKTPSDATPRSNSACHSLPAEKDSGIARIRRHATLLERYDPTKIFSWYEEKYPEASPALALRSMAYFVDAEQQPLPRMLVPFDWGNAKSRIQNAVRYIVCAPPQSNNPKSQINQ